MSTASQISYYLRVAIDVNKKVGGTRAYEAQSNCRDRFLVIRDNVNKSFHFIKAKMEERERKRGADANLITAEIKEKVEDIYNQLDRMRDTVSCEKGANPAAQELKYQLIERLRAQTQELQSLMGSNNDTERSLIVGKQSNQTYTDLRTQLLEPDKVKVRANRIPANKGSVDGPSELQMSAMKRWQEHDKKIDDRIDVLIENTKRWKEGVIRAGELIQETDKKISQLTTDVDKVNDDLLRSNKQLKGVVEKFRKPHKFCLDIVLVLVLIGLIVGVIKLAQK